MSFKLSQQSYQRMSKLQKKAISLLLVLLMISLASASLSVYNLQALQEKDPDFSNISYSIANYGFAPFGKTIVGRLIISPEKGDECTAQADPNVDYQNSFLLIIRGKCDFATKTLNAEKLGAQMAVIMDDQDHQGKVIMADNGYGYKVNIPSIFLTHSLGLKLRTLIQNNQAADDYEATDVLMKITFENKKTDKVDVNFFLQTNNRHSYRFVENFRKFYPKIADNINFNLIYSTTKCLQCSEDDCYNQKEFCAFNYKHDESATGQQILDQQVREQLMFEMYPDQWWKYMQYIGDECNSISQLEDCHNKALYQFQIDSEDFTKKFKSTFDEVKGNNRFLSDNKQQLAKAGVNRYPAVTLNQQKLKGTLHAEFVFDDICNTLTDPPSDCKKYIEGRINYDQSVSIQWPVLVLVVALGISIFSVIFCMYRRYMKKKISNQMHGRVDDMVSKYIEFYSERNK